MRAKIPVGIAVAGVLDLPMRRLAAGFDIMRGPRAAARATRDDDHCAYRPRHACLRAI